MSTAWDEGTIEDIPVGATIRRKVGDYVFRYRPGVGQECMEYYTPTNPRTAAQQLMRKVFADATAAWKALSGAEKAEWWERAREQGGWGLTSSSCIASSGQLRIHSPHPMHWSPSIAAVSSAPSIEIALKKQSSTQISQPVHDSASTPAAKRLGAANVLAKLGSGHQFVQETASQLQMTC